MGYARSARTSPDSMQRPQPSALEAGFPASGYWADQLRGWIQKMQEAFSPSHQADWDAVAAAGYLLDLAKAMEKARGAGVEAGLVDQAKEKLRQSLAIWGVQWESTKGESSAEAGPLVDLLIHVRSRLREAKQWALADEIRHGLSALRILLEDTPEGTRWRRST